MRQNPQRKAGKDRWAIYTVWLPYSKWKAVVGDVTWEQIKALFQTYVSGDSLSEAAKKAGSQASHSVVRRILKNARYLGDAFYPAIIDAETFKTAESERIRRAEKRIRNKNLKSKKRPPFLRPSALRKGRRNTATHLCRRICIQLDWNGDVQRWQTI